MLDRVREEHQMEQKNKKNLGGKRGNGKLKGKV
jgi:hypothetical protein